MSIIVNSGMGASLQGYSSSYRKRTANYDKIGSNAATIAVCGDYNDHAQNDTTSGTAYIISKYATGCSTLGSGGPWDITLDSSGNFTLPDGFRGIGSLYYKNNSLCLKVASLDGNGVTLTQNTQFYTYDDWADSFDTIYTPALFAKADGGDLGNAFPDAGLGLFNRQYNNGATYEDFTLSGSIKYDILNHKTGTSIDYTPTNVNRYNTLSCGALFCVCQVESA